MYNNVLGARALLTFYFLLSTAFTPPLIPFPLSLSLSFFSLWLDVCCDGIMSKLFHPSRSFILFCLTCLQAFGLYFFLKGFLLTRQTLDIQATQHDVWDRFPFYGTDSNTYNNDNNENNNDYDKRHPPTIPPKQPFDRVIMIIIDALRFDFLTPMDVNNSNNQQQQQQYYLNQFPIIEKLHRSNPSSSLLYQFRADPPTTTMQRVKGLMTGSLPTFIDAGANFASSAVNEDHLLRHMRQRYDNIYFMGDDTWVNLFPEVFDDRNKTFESDSFKMFDLHTVDNRILSHLWPLLSSQEEQQDQDQVRDDWQVIIAHFLGVDHCGHTYGPAHPNMANKLSQMNDVIERLTTFVDEDTLLVVMGDHGMSVEGDHGGESVEELMSGLFLYSGRQLTVKENNDDEEGYNYHDLFNRIHQSRAEKLGYPIQEIVDRLGYDATRYPIASQIHLVPTLAYLLDIPIPFGNLGALLPDVLMPMAVDENKSKDQVLLHMAQQFRRNALQVYNYLDTYWHHTQHPGFAPSSLDPIYQHFWNAERMFSNNDQQHGDNDNDNYGIQLMEQIIFEYDTFLISTIKYCDAIWAQFDVGSMMVGIIVLVLTTCATVSVALRSNNLSISLRHFLTVWIITMVTACGGTVLFKYAQDYDWFEKMGWMDGIIAANCMTLAILFLTIPLSTSNEMKAQTTTPVKKGIPLDWVALILGTLINAFTLASNSFVIWEDRGTRFIAATLCIIWFFQSVAASGRCTTLNTEKILELMIPPLIVLIWIRLTGVTGQCREEQFPYCSYIHNGYIKFGGEGSFFINIGYILFNAFLCFYYLPRVFYRMSIMYNNNNKKDWRAVIFTAAYSISLLIVFIRQVTTIYQSSPHEDALGLNIQVISDDNIYNSTMTTATFNMHLLSFKPLSISIQLSQDMYTAFVKILDVYAPRTVYAITLFSTFLGTICIFNKKDGHSGSYLTLMLFVWSVTLAILQQPLGSTILLTSPIIIGLLTRTITPTKTKTATSVNRQDYPYLTQYIQIVLIYIIGHHIFFVTSHQATFTSLPWKAAFIGFDDMNYYGGATLVAMSTLSGYIMTWLGFLSIRYYTRNSQRNGLAVRDRPLLQDHRLSIYLVMILQAIPTCLSAIFVLILRRHLMTWKIFAPRFLLQGLIGMGTSFAVTLCEWLIQEG